MTGAPLPPGLRPGGAADVKNGLEHRLFDTAAAQSQAAVSCEYLATLRSTRFPDLAPLRQAGIGGPGLAVGPALASIQITDGRFQLDTHGDAKAFVIPVRVGNPLTAEVSDPIRAVRCGALIDLLAVSPSYPDRWALRVGNATWLGAIEPQFLMPEPVPRSGAPRWRGFETIAAALFF